MPVKNRYAELHAEITAWRRDFHTHPELLFDLPRTAARVAELLRQFGCDEVVEGIGRTGVVGVIKGKSDTGGRVVGLRADMDALPIHETTGLDYASQTPGMMHVHDVRAFKQVLFWRFRHIHCAQGQQITLVPQHPIGDGTDPSRPARHEAANGGNVLG